MDVHQQLFVKQALFTSKQNLGTLIVVESPRKADTLISRVNCAALFVDISHLHACKIANYFPSDRDNFWNFFRVSWEASGGGGGRSQGARRSFWGSQTTSTSGDAYEETFAYTPPNAQGEICWTFMDLSGSTCGYKQRDPAGPTRIVDCCARF